MGEKESLVLTRAKTLANTYGQAFDRAVTNRKASESGINTFVYTGPSDELTRPFCMALLTGEGDAEFNIPEKKGDEPIYTEDEISEMTNGTDRPVMEFCGGYNCRHKFSPVVLSQKEEEALV